jgi:hypothetical protein
LDQMMFIFYLFFGEAGRIRSKYAMELPI